MFAICAEFMYCILLIPKLPTHLVLHISSQTLRYNSSTKYLSFKKMTLFCFFFFFLEDKFAIDLHQIWWCTQSSLNERLTIPCLSLYRPDTNKEHKICSYSYIHAKQYKIYRKKCYSETVLPVKSKLYASRRRPRSRPLLTYKFMMPCRGDA